VNFALIGQNLIQTQTQSVIWYGLKRKRPLPTLRLTTATHSSRCLKAFHCSSAMNGWWSIVTWTNGATLL